MEQIVFPVHPICEFLTEDSKFRVFNTTEQDEQGSKVTHYFEQTSFLHGEMEWQKKLRSKRTHKEWDTLLYSSFTLLHFFPVISYLAFWGCLLVILLLTEYSNNVFCRYASSLLVLQEDVSVGNHLIQPCCLHKPHRRLLLPLWLWTRY